MKKLKEIWNHDRVVDITIVLLLVILFLEIKYLAT
jgi:hypothetical protein